MNGIELLQLIKEGKVKDDTFIDVYYADDDLGKTLICELRYINNQIYWEEGTFKVSYLYNDSYCFRIVKEILDKEEKKYLSQVIRPFKKEVSYIEKRSYKNGKNEDLHIAFNDGDIWFPRFKKGAMYKGMKADKYYSLKDLNLDAEEINKLKNRDK